MEEGTSAQGRHGGELLRHHVILLAWNSRLIITLFQVYVFRLMLEWARLVTDQSGSKGKKSS